MGISGLNTKMIRVCVVCCAKTFEEKYEFNFVFTKQMRKHEIPYY